MASINMLILSTNPKVNGMYFKDKLVDPLEPVAQSPEVQTALWECSERLVKQLAKEESILQSLDPQINAFRNAFVGE